MPRSEQRSYDDYSYSATAKEKESAGSLSPFTYLCTVLILALLGLIVLYSSSYQKAISEGLPHYYYFFRNLIAGLSALAVAFIVRIFMPHEVLGLRYVLMPLALVLLVLSLIPSLSAGGYITVSGIRIIDPSYLALFTLPFAASQFLTAGKRGAGYYIFAVLTVLMMLLSLVSGGVGVYLILILAFTVMLRISGERRLRTFLSFLILAVLGVIIALIFPQQVLEPVVSSLYSSPDSPVAIAGSIIQRGGITGCGLGKGLFKLYLLSSPESEFIFASFAEEAGYIGTAVLLVLLIFISVLGIRTVQRSISRNDRASAMMVASFTIFIVLTSVINMAYVSSFLPLPGLLLPFFSYDPAWEFISVLSASMLYRLIYIMGRENEKK